MTAAGASKRPAPVACSLAGEDMSDRELQWRALGAAALRARIFTPTGLQIEFEAGRETAHALIDLLAAERTCCRWASWSMTSSADSTVVVVEAEEAAVPVLHAMFGRPPQHRP